MMVLRQIGTMLVRVDDMEPKDRELVEASLRLVGDINAREEYATAATFIGGGLMGCVIGALFHMVVGMLGWMEGVMLPGATLASGVIGGVLVMWSMDRERERLTLNDVGQLDRFRVESEPCRELLAAYRRAYPRQFMDHPAPPPPTGA